MLVATGRLATLAFERATRGTPRELWRDGKLEAETRQPSDRLLIFLLQHLAPHRFASRGEYGRLDRSALDARLALPAMLDRLVDAPVPVDPLASADYPARPPSDALA